MCLPVAPITVLKEWDHAGLKCAITQIYAGGHLCAYVRLPPGHPYHGKQFHDLDVRVHHELTFAELEPCSHDDGQGWWLGFDCGQFGDLLFDPLAEITWISELPTRVQDLLRGYMTPWPSHYWRQPEVEAETNLLAELLSQASDERGRGRERIRDREDQDEIRDGSSEEPDPDLDTQTPTPVPIPAGHKPDQASADK